MLCEMLQIHHDEWHIFSWKSFSVITMLLQSAISALSIIDEITRLNIKWYLI